MDYGTHAYLWSVGDMVRLFFMTALVLLVEKSSTNQFLLAIVTNLLALLAHTYVQPFVRRTFFWLQLAMFVSLTLVFYFGLLIKVSSTQFLSWE